MPDDSQRPIVIKRIKKAGDAHHGGAWKIAYADFVTAMMAFFLLMWLLGSATKAQLQGIADYFKTPLKVALEEGSGSGTTASIIKGGGRDLTRKVGQVRRGENPPTKNVTNLKQAKAELERQEAARLSNMKDKLERLIQDSSQLKQFKNQLKLDITSEGLRIQIVDDKNRPMFDSGSAVMKPYTRVILSAIGKTLNDLPNKISLAGYTDATQYVTGIRGYSNWELSTDRANAARRELVAGGLAANKLLRVVGLGSAVPFDKANPYAPVNRRISIIVLNKKTEDAITKEGQAVQASSAQQANKELSHVKQ